jgi:hypothetical protein
MHFEGSGGRLPLMSVDGRVDLEVRSVTGGDGKVKRRRNDGLARLKQREFVAELRPEVIGEQPM